MDRSDVDGGVRVRERPAAERQAEAHGDRAAEANPTHWMREITRAPTSWGRFLHHTGRSRGPRASGPRPVSAARVSERDLEPGAAARVVGRRGVAAVTSGRLQPDRETESHPH